MSNIWILVFGMMTSHLAHAFPDCGIHQSVLRDFQGVSQYVHKTVQVGEADRLTDKEYAAAHGETVEKVQERFAASGDLTCPKAEGRAHLVIKNDVIVTVGHIIHTREGCAPNYNDLSDCTFTAVWKGKPRTARIKQILASGYSCPLEAGGDFAKDWMVLRLDHPIEDIQPYQVDNSATEALKEGSKVVAVGKSIDFTRKVSGKLVSVKHYADCSVMDFARDTYLKPTYMYSDCDGSFGTSGGGIFDGNHDQPTLLGLVRGGPSVSYDGEVQAGRTGKPISREYSMFGWSMEYVPIVGKLYKALQEVKSVNTGI